MEVNEVHDQDMLVDLEKGNCLLPREGNNGTKINSIAGHAKTMLHGSYDDPLALKEDKSRHISFYSSHCRDSIVKSGESMTSEGEIKVGLLDKSAGNKEKKKWFKKPPRPPRPPTSSPLDPADQKLISELSELAVLKRARIERMKALKKMKNSKPASSIGNLVALIITIIFCFFILWQARTVACPIATAHHKDSYLDSSSPTSISILSKIIFLFADIKISYLASYLFSYKAIILTCEYLKCTGWPPTYTR